MNIKALAAVALAATLALCLVPIGDVDAVYSDVDGDFVVGVDTDAEYAITYTNHDYDNYEDMSMSIAFTAKLVDSRGETVSNGVSPSSGSLDNGISKTLTVDVPKNAGTYKLYVTYDVEVSYTEDGKTVDVDEKDLEREDVVSIKAVQPITLSVTFKNDSPIDLSGYGVYFYVNGEKIEDSYTTLDVAKDGTSTVSYKWITDSPEGKYTYSVQPADSGNLVEITGLGEEYTFYIGDSSYTMWTVLLVVLVILLILIMVWVYRKPVKNFGKPKSRR